MVCSVTANKWLLLMCLTQLQFLLLKMLNCMFLDFKNSNTQISVYLYDFYPVKTVVRLKNINMFLLITYCK